MLTVPYCGIIYTYNFPVSCSEPSQQRMERGVALLHHMTYTGARKVFESIRTAELAGDKKKAAAYYRKISKLTEQADTKRPRLQNARRFTVTRFAQ